MRVAGHSLGGATALQAAVLDPRFRTVIDIDGFPRVADPGSHRPPVLALVALAATIGGADPAVLDHQLPDLGAVTAFGR